MKISRPSLALVGALFLAGAAAFASPAIAESRLPHPESCKPLPGVTVAWVGPQDPEAGSVAQYAITLTARVPVAGLRLDIEIPEGLELPGGIPRFQGSLGEGESRTFFLDALIPATPVAPLRAVARVGADAEGRGGYRVGSTLRLGPRPAPRPARPEAIALRGHTLRPRGSAAPAQQTVITGRFLYRDRSIDDTGFVHATFAEDPMKPVRRAVVELVRDGATVATTPTDETGAFRFEIASGGSTYQVRALTDTHASTPIDIRVVISTTNPAVHSSISSTVPAPPAGNDLDFGDLLIEADGAGAAFNVLDATIDGADLVTELRGTAPAPSLIVFWNAASRDGTYYRRSERGVHLLDEEGYDDSVIIHEYGHYVAHQFSKDDSNGGQHFINDSGQDPRLSWSEGWASFWQSAARERIGDGFPSWYVDTDGTPGAGNLFFSYDCEGPSVAVSGTGAEVVVQAALWDIIDGASTHDPQPTIDDDELELDGSLVWDVFAGPLRSTTQVSLEDFWNAWFSSVVPSRAPEMEALFGALGAEYFDDANEPNDSAGAASPLSLDGAALHGTFYPSGDQDFFRVDLAAGDEVTVETLNIVGFGDTRLDILAPDQSIIASNDNRSTEDVSSVASFTAPAAGTYTVQVRRGSSGFAAVTEYGSYDVRGLRGAPNTTPLASVAGVAGVANTGFSVGSAFADADLDGDLDLYVVNNSAGGSALEKDAYYRNRGTGAFLQVTAGSGFGSPEGGVGAAWGDLDNDGDPDLFVTDHGLFRNNGDGTFSDMTESSGVADLGREFDAAWADADGDGWLDLFVTMRDRPSALWHNNTDGTFTDVAGEAGFGFLPEGSNAYSGSWGDYDADGLPDLFVAHSSERGHALFHNLGENRFEDVTVAAGVASDMPAVGSVWGDVDGDGRLDLYVASSRENRLYRNLGDGAFEDIAGRYGVNDVGGSRGAALLDIDLDGDLDLYVVNFNGSSGLYENLGTGMIRSTQGSFTGLAHSCAWADYDGDGDPDLHLAVQSGANLLFRNQTNGAGNDRPWLQIRLQGIVSNRDGIGAEVRVYAGNTVQMRQVGTGTGWAARSRVPEVFGFTDGVSVDSLRVDWPSGAYNVVVNPPVGALITVEEDTTTQVVDPGTNPPVAVLLRGAFPNPFFTAATIRFELPRATRVRIEVFDIQGRRARVVLDEDRPQGKHAAIWDGRDDTGRAVAPGVYFARMQAEGVTQVQRVVRVGR